MVPDLGKWGGLRGLRSGTLRRRDRETPLGDLRIGPLSRTELLLPHNSEMTVCRDDAGAFGAIVAMMTLELPVVQRGVDASQTAPLCQMRPKQTHETESSSSRQSVAPEYLDEAPWRVIEAHQKFLSRFVE